MEKKKTNKKKEPPEKHTGSVFIATPDGNAFVFNLVGTSQPSSEVKRISAEVQCKTPHSQPVEVSNWLKETQRFDVKLTLVEPADAGEEIKLHGVNTFDLPPGVSKEYKFNVYAYRVGRALVRLDFTNGKTGEFLTMEVELKFVAPDSIGLINFNTVCRQTVKHPISIQNPLTAPVAFKCEASNADITFSPADFTVPPSGEGIVDVLFKPILAGSGETSLRLKSSELGDYPYTVHFEAKPAGLEKAPVFKAPLGSMDTVHAFKFMHHAKKAATYTARIEAAPGHKAPIGDFIVDTKEVKANAAGDEPVEVAVDVRFQPSQLGESRTLLVLTSPDGGDYKALLVGYAQPPQPQGPVVLQSGKPGEIEFVNPFEDTVDFTIQVDNPAFTVGSRTFRVDGKKSTKIGVQFKAEKKQKGCLTIATAKASWKYFLEGTV